LCGGCSDRTSGENFVAEKSGADTTRVLIVSAHLDSVGNAGANDDATGVIASLAVAKALSKQPLAYNLRILGFDEEEIGLVGSSRYVASLNPAQKLLSVIHMEMMGTNSRKDGAFHVIDCDRADSMPTTKRILEAVATLNLPLKRTSACTTRSDHGAFWKAGLPAIVISENFFGGDGDPCYHRACDIADARIQYDYIANITKAVTLAVSEMLK
jgi:Zn-dependent M28 family amino/carboxypeptidase